MVKNTYMRVNKKLLEELKARKQVPRESYADVVKRMIDKETGKKKKKPKSIQDFEILAREGGMRF